MANDVATLAALLEHAPVQGRRPALVCPDDGLVRSYDELRGAIDGFGRRLHAAGVQRGDRVALVLDDGPEVVEAVLGIAAIGAQAAPLNPAYTQDEFAFYLDDIAPRMLLLPAGRFEAARRAAGPATLIGDIVAEADPGLRLWTDGAEVLPAQTAEPGQADDVALLLHTSGTTSRPKQVPLSQRNLVHSARSIAAHYELTGADVAYCAMPLFHVHGLVASCLATLGSGGTVILPRRRSRRSFWAQAREQSVTWFSASPTIHQMFAQRADDESPIPSLRFVRSCSAPLAPDVMRRLEELYGVPVLQAYGMTEASHEMSANPLPPGSRVPGSVGIPTGAEIRVIGEDGNDVPPGTPGEVVIRGGGVTTGYLNNPEANADAFIDGWFRTGDLGVFLDGHLHLRGRIKELIIRGGENISPFEVEDVLLGHPAVREAVCFAIEDVKYNEVVGAAVVLEADATETHLLDHCAQRLAAFKVPAALFIVEAVPRTATGKVQRRHVAAMLAPETDRRRSEST